MEQRIYIAITGTQYYYGASYLKPGQIVHLSKDPDNPHDHEAILASMTPLGKIGYVANNPRTTPKGCHSAGRIYDMFEHHISGIVRFVVKDTVIVQLVPDAEEVYIVKTTEGESFIHFFRQEEPDKLSNY